MEQGRSPIPKIRPEANSYALFPGLISHDACYPIGLDEPTQTTGAGAPVGTPAPVRELANPRDANDLLLLASTT